MSLHKYFQRFFSIHFESYFYLKQPNSKIHVYFSKRKQSHQYPQFICLENIAKHGTNGTPHALLSQYLE